MTEAYLMCIHHSWQQTPSTIYGVTAGDLKLRQECEFTEFPCDVLPILLTNSTCDVIQFSFMVPDTTHDTTPSASGDSVCDEALQVRLPHTHVHKSTAHANLQHPHIQ